jgi:hypothetical protein
MSDDERIGSFIACPDCGEPRVALPVALRLAEMAKSVPEWRDLVDAQEGFQDNIEAMQELGPITLTWINPRTSSGKPTAGITCKRLLSNQCKGGVWLLSGRTRPQGLDGMARK